MNNKYFKYKERLKYLDKYGLNNKMITIKLLTLFKEQKMLLLENSKEEVHSYKIRKTLTLLKFLNISKMEPTSTVSKRNHGINYSKYFLKLLLLPQYKLIQVLLL